MQVVVLATEGQKAELKNSPESVRWIESAAEFLQYTAADAYVDLQFVPDHLAVLNRLHPQTVIVNSVAETLSALHPEFVRINGWNTFLSSPVIEATCNLDIEKEKADAVFALFDKTICWLPDTPGFVTPRVVSMIIHEAFLALDEGVSTEEEINTAMKLGTAYPFGPFEWAAKIGLTNCVALLKRMAETEPRYTPCDGMRQAADSVI